MSDTMKMLFFGVVICLAYMYIELDKTKKKSERLIEEQRTFHVQRECQDILRDLKTKKKDITFVTDQIDELKPKVDDENVPSDEHNRLRNKLINYKKELKDLNEDVQSLLNRQSESKCVKQSNDEQSTPKG